jgi:RND family efflux transporter MFP subunit
MNTTLRVLIAASLLGAGLAAGYWWGSGKAKVESRKSAAMPSKAADTPKGKILYYRNPMGLPDTSPVPKKDPMGMDYVPVYEGEEPSQAATGLTISADKIQKLGVRTETAALRALARTVRAVGTLQVDERRVHTVSPKFEGWIERLQVNTTGQPVARGQPLMEVYSPELVIAQQEYLVAARGIEAVREAGPETQAGMRQLMAGALQRLRNWDISEAELDRLQKEGAIRRSITLRSPVAGVVMEKRAVQGMRFMPGEALYQISDLSSMWILAEVFEQDIALVQPGQAARISVNGLPGRAVTGKVAFLYPAFTAETRTGKVRIELPNPGGTLKPGMYATVELAASPARKVLAVPESSVIDSGVRRIVLVQEGDEVKLGMRADDYVEVLDGVREGESVVVAANFLIDAESNLRAALGTGGAPARAPAAPAAHRADGRIESVDVSSGTLTIAHGAVPSLKWPEMTMEFPVANSSLMSGIAPGAAVSFEFVERGPGEYVVTKIAPRGPARAAQPRGDHSGH